MNQVVITGNLGADPESKFSSEGTQITSFPIAFKSTFKTDKTNWIKITCFNSLAETAEKYLHKGARIGVVGLLDQDKWVDDEGQARTNYKLLANNLEFIKTDGRGFDNGKQADANDETPF